MDFRHSQVVKSIFDVSNLPIPIVRHFIQLLLLEKLPTSEREAVFFQLVDELPMEESLRLLSMKSQLLEDLRAAKTKVTWKPVNSPLSLLCAFASGDLENEAKIVHKNKSVFFCTVTL